MISFWLEITPRIYLSMEGCYLRNSKMVGCGFNNGILQESDTVGIRIGRQVSTDYYYDYLLNPKEIAALYLINKQ